jgi:hypothetical protein
MNSKRLARLLAAPALIASIIAGVLCVWYLYASRQSLVTQGEAARATLVINNIRGLLADCAEYAKRDQDMAALLKSLDSSVATNAVPSAPVKPSPTSR